jgi:uncharacterized GH25 family protein
MRVFVFILSLLLSLPVFAHEYWIEPKNYAVPANTNVAASLFNGKNFAGSEFAYAPQQFTRFELVSGDTAIPITGRLGDKPALNMPPIGDGLHIAVYQSVLQIITYQDFELFTKFVTHKDLKGTLERHAARGLPQTGFREFYTRFSKALVAVGDGAGQDRSFGLEIELVALKNPYTDDVSVGLPVRSLYQDKPRPDVQIELFEKDPTGKVEVTLHRTNAAGIALLPVKKGYSYLVDNVVLREPVAGSIPAEKGAAWESLWAALTFAVPG